MCMYYVQGGLIKVIPRIGEQCNCDFMNLCFYIFIFYFRTTMPIIVTESKNHNGVKGIWVCLNKNHM